MFASYHVLRLLAQPFRGNLSSPMGQTSIDTVVRLRLHHTPGQRARVAKVVGDGGGVIGDLTTIGVGELFSIRDITVETGDEEHTERIVTALRGLSDVEVLSVTDRVFAAHAGGKIHSHEPASISGQLPDRRPAIHLHARRRPRRARPVARPRARVGADHARPVGRDLHQRHARPRPWGHRPCVAALPVMEGAKRCSTTASSASARRRSCSRRKTRWNSSRPSRVSRRASAPSHLEDIRVPDCFVIEEALKKRLAKPVVMHDDQHGTATAALAAIVNACKMTGLDLAKARPRADRPRRRGERHR